MIDPQVLADFRQKPVQFEKIIAFLDEQPEITAAHLCSLIDVSVQRVYRWRNENAKEDPSNVNHEQVNEFKVVPSSRKKGRYTAGDKLAILKQYEKLDPVKRAELLRTYGLYQSDITRWQDTVDAAALESLSKRKSRSDKKSDETKAFEDLQKEVATHEKTIAKLAALVVLQKKVSDVLKK